MAIAENNLGIFKLNMKTRMKSTEMNQAVVFGRCSNLGTIAFVTGAAAHHCSEDADTDPEIVAENRQVQIIDYDASEDSQWSFSERIATNAATVQIEGVLPLHSVAHQKHQPKTNGMFLILIVFGVLTLIVLRDFCTAVLKNVSNVTQVRQKMSFVRF